MCAIVVDNKPYITDFGRIICLLNFVLDLAFGEPFMHEAIIAIKLIGNSIATTSLGKNLKVFEEILFFRKTVILSILFNYNSIFQCTALQFAAMEISLKNLDTICF